MPKRCKANLHQMYFSKPRMIWYHKGSHPVLVWEEKRSYLGRGGLLCENSVPKFVLDFCPVHWGGPFGPKLHEPSSYIIQTWFVSKKSHFRTFAPLTPSGIFTWWFPCQNYRVCTVYIHIYNICGAGQLYTHHIVLYNTRHSHMVTLSQPWSQKCRVGQNHIFTVYIRYFGWDLIKCTVIYGIYTYTILANPTQMWWHHLMCTYDTVRVCPYTPSPHDLMLTITCSHRQQLHRHGHTITCSRSHAHTCNSYIDMATWPHAHNHMLTQATAT